MGRKPLVLLLNHTYSVRRISDNNRIGQHFGGFGMLLVSEDLSSMTVWTILYYTRYVGKLSTRSLSYLCPDLPIVVRKHYNRRSLWLSSSCERTLFKCNKAQVCKYACTLVCTYTLTYIRRSNFTFCVGVFNQIHYRWCHKTDAASMWHNINGTSMYKATLFQTTVAFVSCDNRFAVFHSNCI